MNFDDFVERCVVSILLPRKSRFRPESWTIVGTGFWVSPAGYCITCHHVLTDNGLDPSDVHLKYRETVLHARLVQDISNLEKDTAVLRVSSPLEEPVECVPLGSAKPDTEVRLFGYRMGFTDGYRITGTLRPGQNLHSFGMVYNLETSLPGGSTVGGMSGAPVFDPRRKVVVGIQHGEEEKGPSTTYIHPIEVAYETWPDLNRIAPPTGIERATAKATLSKLPSTGHALFGREDELKQLNEAWNDISTSVLCLVAWGGVGKTSLVNHWLERLKAGGFDGAERVYAWSFYSQGAVEGRQASADAFLTHALEWFGDTEAADDTSWAKGVRLAELIREQRTLLILDGLEPLQYPPGDLQGQLRDAGLKALLKELDRTQHKSLCVITTRLPVEDIRGARTINLEGLSKQAGAELLRSLDVREVPFELEAERFQEELERAVADYEGHALGLTLLGRHIAIAYNGDIRQRDKVSAQTGGIYKDPKHGGHARRVMEAYERWIGDTPERNILYLMGLFDRPASLDALEALIAAEPIDGLTSGLRSISTEDWKFALARLRDARLIAEEHPGQPDTLDCHPLVREHFGVKLRADNPRAWRAAHDCLYEYFKGLPATHQPATLEEMEPLFQAIRHGCQAGRHQEALQEIYGERINRNGAFIVKQLGALGTHLVVISNFFERPWTRPASGLSDAYKAWILNLAGYGLAAMGRLREATEPMRAGLDMKLQGKNWKGASGEANNLSSVHLKLGELKKAVAYARKSIAHADRDGDEFHRQSACSTLAHVLHQLGDATQAEEWFKNAEDLQKQRQPEIPFLCSVDGFDFCDLLLDQGKYEDARSRANRALLLAEGNGSKLDIVLHKLTLGRVFTLEYLRKGFGGFNRVKPRSLGIADKSISVMMMTGDSGGATSSPAVQAALLGALAVASFPVHLDEAVEGLRGTERQDYLPLALLTRAALRRAHGALAEAQSDLDDALDVAEKTGMRLYLADYHLEACRLRFAMSRLAGRGGSPEGAEEQREKASDHLRKGRSLVAMMDYHRRDAEVVGLERMLSGGE
ncbi:trypsin-like peptidase domain-containing protein [Archangium lipolyticum]|uniref:trypsin-like peptidase domain-containing protein n=1 Tax=Archangium lipolyticum TaxID=2970465 RepID=UPI00214A5705|nr:trypsin-like peptidase domain-containing protein [Archangium lipolyticum]